MAFANPLRVTDHEALKLLPTGEKKCETVFQIRLIIRIQSVPNEIVEPPAVISQIVICDKTLYDIFLSDWSFEKIIYDRFVLFRSFLVLEKIKKTFKIEPECGQRREYSLFGSWKLVLWDN